VNGAPQTMHVLVAGASASDAPAVRPRSLARRREAVGGSSPRARNDLALVLGLRSQIWITSRPLPYRQRRRQRLEPAQQVADLAIQRPQLGQHHLNSPGLSGSGKSHHQFSDSVMIAAVAGGLR
jgi:hypothetical protein